MATKKETLQFERIPFQFQLEPQAENDYEAGRFSGYASIWGSVVDTFPNRTRFRRGAFLKTINDRMSRIKILAQHNQESMFIGLPTMLKETDQGLYVEASLNKTQAGLDVAEALRHAASLGKLDTAELSIGFDAMGADMVEDEQDGEIFREITEARLWEISVVNFGADRKTYLTEAASLELEDVESFSVPGNVSTKKADMATAWSAPSLKDFTSDQWGDLSNAEKNRIAGHFAWADASPPSSFGGLKLPHHRASDGAVVWNGVVAATARFNQLQVPAADKAAIKAHLRAHYRAFDKEVPDILKQAKSDPYETLTIPKPDRDSVFRWILTNLKALRDGAAPFHEHAPLSEGQIRQLHEELSLHRPAEPPEEALTELKQARRLQEIELAEAESAFELMKIS